MVDLPLWKIWVSWDDIVVYNSHLWILWLYYGNNDHYDNSYHYDIIIMMIVMAVLWLWYHNYGYYGYKHYWLVVSTYPFWKIWVSWDDFSFPTGWKVIIHSCSLNPEPGILWYSHSNWLVVLTILKNISQWEGLSHILWKIKKLEATNQVIYVCFSCRNLTCNVGKTIINQPILMVHAIYGDSWDGLYIIVLTTLSTFQFFDTRWCPLQL